MPINPLDLASLARPQQQTGRPRPAWFDLFEEDQPKQPEWYDVAAGAGLRIAPSILGGVIGAAALAGTGPGAIAGGIGGRGIGSAAGEYAAQAYERARGIRRDPNTDWTAVGVEGLIGGTPIDEAITGVRLMRTGLNAGQAYRALPKALSTIAPRVGTGMAHGAVGSMAGEVMRSEANEGKLPDLERLLTSGAFGATIGGAAAGLIKGYRRYKGRAAQGKSPVEQATSEQVWTDPPSPETFGKFDPTFPADRNRGSIRRDYQADAPERYPDLYQRDARGLPIERFGGTGDATGPSRQVPAVPSEGSLPTREAGWSFSPRANEDIPGAPLGPYGGDIDPGVIVRGERATRDQQLLLGPAPGPEPPARITDPRRLLPLSAADFAPVDDGAVAAANTPGRVFVPGPDGQVQPLPRTVGRLGDLSALLDPRPVADTPLSPKSEALRRLLAGEPPSVEPAAAAASPTAPRRPTKAQALAERRRVAAMSPEDRDAYRAEKTATRAAQVAENRRIAAETAAADKAQRAQARDDKKMADLQAALGITPDAKAPPQSTVRDMEGNILGEWDPMRWRQGGTTADLGRPSPDAPAPAPSVYQEPLTPADNRFQASQQPGPGDLQVVDAAALKTDARLYQHKSGTDAQGVLDKLRRVEAWDPLSGSLSPLLVHERLDGSRYVVDGHQRVGLAKRLIREGKPVPPLPARILRETDGWTPEMMRRTGALHNLRGGTADPWDIATFLQTPLTEGEKFRVKQITGMDPDQEFRTIRQIESDIGEKFKLGVDLARLRPEAMNYAKQNEVPAHIARAVGRDLEGEAPQVAALQLIDSMGVHTADEVDALVRQIKNAGFQIEQQQTLFGMHAKADPLLGHVIKLAAATRSAITKRRIVAAGANRGATTLAAEGIAADINTARAQDVAKEAAAELTMLDQFEGKVTHTQEALKNAAARLARGEITQADAVDAVRAALQLDIQGVRLRPGTGQNDGDLGALADDAGTRLAAGEPGADGADAAAVTQSGAGLFDEPTATVPEPVGTTKPARLTLYHGTRFGQGPLTPTVHDETNLTGIAFSTDRNVATRYANNPDRILRPTTGGQPHVVETQIESARTRPLMQFYEELEQHYKRPLGKISDSERMKYAKDNGIDALDTSAIGAPGEYFVIDPSAIRYDPGIAPATQADRWRIANALKPDPGEVSAYARTVATMSDVAIKSEQKRWANQFEQKRHGLTPEDAAERLVILDRELNRRRPAAARKLRKGGDESGMASHQLATTLAGAGVGAVTGGALPGTPEERRDRALAGALLGGIGGAAVSRHIGLKLPRAPGDVDLSGTPTISKTKSVYGTPAPREERIWRMTNWEPIAPNKPLPPHRITSFNLGTFSPEIRTEIHNSLIESMGYGAQRRGVQPDATTIEKAKRIATSLSKVLKPGTALNAEGEVAYGMALTGATKRMQDVAKRVAANEARGVINGDDQKAWLESVADYNTVLTSWAGIGSEAGRSLRARRIANAMMPAEIRVIMQAEKDNPLSAQLRAAMALTGDPIEAVKLWQKDRKGGGMMKYILTNMLSGVQTQERNILGTMAATANRMVTKPLVAVPYDVLRSTLSRTPREVYLRESIEDLKGIYAGFKPAVRDMMHVLTYGFSAQHLNDALESGDTFKLPGKEFAGGLKNPYNAIGRALSANDRFWSGLNASAELHARSYTMARNALSAQGVKSGSPHYTDALAKQIIDIRANPSKALTDSIEKVSRDTVMTGNPGPLAMLIGKAKSEHPSLVWVMAFERIAANMMRLGYEHTPISLAVKGAKRIAGNVDAFGATPRDRTMMVSKGLAGAAAMIPMAMLAAEGRLSGDGPKNAAKRAQLMESGWTPHSIKVPLPDAFASTIGASKSPDGEYWVNYQLMQPLAFGASLVANGFEAWADETERQSTSTRPENAARFASEVVAKMGKSVLSQSFLTGLNDLLNGIDQGGSAMQKFFEGIGRTLVPLQGALRNVQRAMDPVVRQPELPGESIKAGLPFLSEEVQPMMGRYGEPIIRSGSALRRSIGVPEVSPQKADWIDNELNRLDVQIGRPSDSITVRNPATGEKYRLTPEQTTAIRESRGKSVRAELAMLIGTPGYTDLPDEIKRQLIARSRSHASSTAREAAQIAVVTGDLSLLEQLLAPQREIAQGSYR